MTDIAQEKIIEFVSKIGSFEHRGNYVAMRIDADYGKEKITQFLNSIGITDIIKVMVNAVGARPESYVFVLNYQYANAQRNVIQNLEDAHRRIQAWFVLRGNGGIQMTPAEQEFFARRDMAMAARRMQNNNDK